MKAIGVDIGGTTIKAGLVDENGKVLYKNAIPTGLSITGEELLANMLDLVAEVAEHDEKGLADIAGVGFGFPGLTNQETGMLCYAMNLPMCKNLAVGAAVEQRFGLKAFVDNDANVAALGESLFGAGNGKTRCTVLVTLGTGVGGGVIINGKIFSGAYHGGTELGHHIIVDGGEPCNCGRRGCWESYASATALNRMAKAEAEKHPDSKLYELTGGDLNALNGKIISEAVDDGDEAANAAMKTYIHYLAIGLGNMYNIFQPEVMMLGGGISGRGEKLLKPLMEELPGEIFGGDMGLVDVRIAELGNDAGIIGAAAMAF